MTLWGNADQANNAPKYHILATSNARGNTMFANVTIGAFHSQQAIGVFGVRANVAQASPHTTHSGWVKVVQGTGPLTSLTVTAGGTGYSNTDVITVSGGAVNATYSLSTNATGGIASVTQTAPGSSFLNASNTKVAVANSTGGNSSGNNTATFAFTLGGRAGRVFMETLVATGSITGNDAVFPTLG